MIDYAKIEKAYTKITRELLENVNDPDRSHAFSVQAELSRTMFTKAIPSHDALPPEIVHNKYHSTEQCGSGRWSRDAVVLAHACAGDRYLSVRLSGHWRNYGHPSGTYEWVEKINITAMSSEDAAIDLLNA